MKCTNTCFIFFLSLVLQSLSSRRSLIRSFCHSSFLYMFNLFMFPSFDPFVLSFLSFVCLYFSFPVSLFLRLISCMALLFVLLSVLSTPHLLFHLFYRVLFLSVSNNLTKKERYMPNGLVALSFSVCLGVHSFRRLVGVVPVRARDVR